MAVALINTKPNRAEWEAAFRRQAPELDFRVWPDCGDLSEIEHAIVVFPDPGALAQLPNLKAIHSLWAGIDHLTRDPDLPTTAPIIRMVDHGLTQGMLDYVTGHVYRYHLQMPEFEALQARREWNQVVPPLAEERTVGVMGLGVLGSEIAAQLVSLGFRVTGWARRPKRQDGVEVFAGKDGLTPFLASAEILVLLLPKTAATDRILNAATIAALPDGAAVINGGRGELIDDEALVAALDSGKLAGATLDVFRTEPLPQDHPFWRHPKVFLTPHVAAETRIESGTATVLKNIRYLDAGGPIDDIPGVVDHAAGY